MRESEALTPNAIHPTEESVVMQTLNLAKHCLSCCSCNKHSIHPPGQRKYGLECNFNQFKQTRFHPRPVWPNKDYLSNHFLQFSCRYNLLDYTQIYIELWPVVTWIETVEEEYQLQREIQTVLYPLCWTVFLCAPLQFIFICLKIKLLLRSFLHPPPSPSIPKPSPTRCSVNCWCFSVFQTLVSFLFQKASPSARPTCLEKHQHSSHGGSVCWCDWEQIVWSLKKGSPYITLHIFFDSVS